MIKSRIALTGCLLVVAGAANAGLSVTPAVVSDYDFRGVTQTDGDPAVQLGATYSFDSGFYVGAWGSNIDFGPGDPNIEIDYFAGFAGGDASESFGYDIGLNYYTYPNAGSINTLEVYAGISKGWFAGKVWYSPDVSSSDDSSFYVEGNATIPLPLGFALTGHVGYSTSKAYVDYVDYAVGVGYDIGKVSLAVKYVDNDLDLTGDHRGAVIGSISTTLPWSE